MKKIPMILLLIALLSCFLIQASSAEEPFFKPHCAADAQERLEFSLKTPFAYRRKVFFML